MMKVCLDSSAFAKRFVEEQGSDAVEAVCAQADELGLSVLCVPEVISALNRRLRERMLSPVQYRQAKQRLLDDVRDADIIQLTPSVVGSAIQVLEASPVRAMDALHIACALEWGADLFVSADTRQLAAVKRAGLKTKQT
jgi:predicted nucleic acid-binding protein